MLAHQLLLAWTVLLVLPVNVSSAQDTKVPIRGLVSMGAYHFVGYAGDPVNTLDPLNAEPGIFGGLVVIASWKRASAIELYQDYGGFPLVADAKPRQWASMLEGTSAWRGADDALPRRRHRPQ